LVAVGTTITDRPRTDPYVQSYRIRLLPKVCDAKKRSSGYGCRTRHAAAGRACCGSRSLSLAYASWPPVAAYRPNSISRVLSGCNDSPISSVVPADLPGTPAPFARSRLTITGRTPYIAGEGWRE
jgi:hypothetical protein